MRVIAIAIVTFVALATAARSAEACPCCEPCNKYKRDRIVLPQPVEVYVRERPAAMPKPARRAKVMALLTGSKWRPRTPAKSGALRLRIFDGSNMPDTVATADDIDHQIVRELVLEDGRFLIDLGGGRYQVSPCRDRGRVTSCLVRVP